MDDKKLVEAVREFEYLWKVGCKSILGPRRMPGKKLPARLAV